MASPPPCPHPPFPAVSTSIIPPHSAAVTASSASSSHSPVIPASPLVRSPNAMPSDETNSLDYPTFRTLPAAQRLPTSRCPPFTHSSALSRKPHQLPLVSPPPPLPSHRTSSHPPMDAITEPPSLPRLPKLSRLPHTTQPAFCNNQPLSSKSTAVQNSHSRQALPRPRSQLVSFQHDPPLFRSPNATSADISSKSQLLSSPRSQSPQPITRRFFSTPLYSVSPDHDEPPSQIPQIPLSSKFSLRPKRRSQPQPENRLDTQSISQSSSPSPTPCPSQTPPHPALSLSPNHTFKNHFRLRRPPPLNLSSEPLSFSAIGGPSDSPAPIVVESTSLSQHDVPRDSSHLFAHHSKCVKPTTFISNSTEQSKNSESGKMSTINTSDPYILDEASNSSLGVLEDVKDGPLSRYFDDSFSSGNLSEVQEDDFQMVGDDGTVYDGGFILFNDGRIQTPEKLMRKTSDGLAVEGVPTSSSNLIIVRSLSEFRKSHSLKSNRSGGSTLGRGAAGRVYLAVHRPSKKKIAVKEINFFHQEKRKQLCKELVTLISHRSRFLVRSYGAFHDGNGIVHVTLEYMDCGSLADIIRKRGSVPEAVICKIAEHCLRGLCFLHSNHILHRDVKTANILLSRKLCRAKLSDFGLACDLKENVNDEDRTDSVTKTFVGTLKYMSPERLHGQEYTYASDIWALGVSLIECVLGRCPFEKLNGFFDVLHATESPLAEQVRGRVSPKLFDLIRLMTDREACKRPTAKDLLQHDFIQSGKNDVNAMRKWLDGVPRLHSDKVDLSQKTVKANRQMSEKKQVRNLRFDKKSKPKSSSRHLDWKKKCGTLV